MNNKFFIIFILAIILISEIYSSFRAKITKNNIFTFWEPRNKIPGYLKLCIKTWEKYLPQYKINILDYEKAKEYIGEKLFSKIVCKNMTMRVQADAIRVALLNKYGGIWLDTDTIVFNGKFFEQFRNYELAMIGENKKKIQYIGFIYANNSSLIKIWLNQIIDRIKYYKYILSNKQNTKSWNNSWDKVNSLFYLGYHIINPLLKNITDKRYFRLDSSSINTFPERTLFKNISSDDLKLYKIFYFEKGDPEIIIKKSKGFILLHNGVTPKKYKDMTEAEFLNEDILLSKLLSKLLEEKI